ncbi:hypothetical protein [Flagellimonas eckloniae]|uniref:Uncharacterized protein n=1 Tax=Flagellimonas eckloniae TaxID=346185 RepID=A0A0N8WGG5_9FLAO|nr:hypothetical protein [Allomuricauda eckloniae]KQC31435.1 hypothetical protein AAY42_17315 [Allomuricauda eckloniae]
MSASAELKREILWVNHDGIEKTLSQYSAWAEQAKYALDQAQKLLPEPLSIEERELLLHQGWSALEGLIRTAYGFPKATVEFVLSSQGLDGSVAKAAFDLVPGRHSAVGFAIIDGDVQVSPETVKKVKDRNHHYVKNDMQSNALNMAKDLCKTLNAGFENGVINMDDRTRLVNAFSKYLELTSARKEDQVFVPAVKRIAQLRA